MLLWDIARATGIVAIVLYTLSATWGILVAGRGIERPAKIVEMHRALQGIALLAVLVHVIALLVNPHAGVGLAALVGLDGGVGIVLGAIALWLAALLPVSFALRTRRAVGYRTWRWLHYLAYPFWAAAVIHGMINGTDSGNAAALTLYGAAAALVVGATAWRLLGRRPTSDPTPAAPAARTARGYTVYAWSTARGLPAAGRSSR